MGIWLGFAVFAVGFGDVPAPPGAVIDHIAAKSRNYIGSPSIVVLDDGSYAASHDFFGPGPQRNRTAVFGSNDRGNSWKKLSEVPNQFWSTIFARGNELFLIGTKGEHGAAIVRRSMDRGATWTDPADRSSGLLLADGKYHCAPVPVVVHAGRIWRCMEDAMGPGKWGSHFRAFVLSAPIDADLLNADNWTVSNRLGRNPQWLGGQFGGWLEGNFVVGRNGELWDILRVDYRTDNEKAALIRIIDPQHIQFDAQRDFVDFPGGCKKFTIRFDPQSDHYWTLANAVDAPHLGSGRPDRVRNALYLCRSADLRNWEKRARLLYHADTAKHAFQYVDWLFDGSDIIAVSRTAWDDADGGAHNQHDANFMTFHRIADFRALKGN